MKQVGIITLTNLNNFGNRLQNYAVQEILKKHGYSSVTFKNYRKFNNRKRFFIYKFISIIKRIKKGKRTLSKREEYFDNFNKRINLSKRLINPFIVNTKPYDYFIVGSDQVWNPTFECLSDVELLSFASPKKRIAFSASFGVNTIDKKFIPKAKKEITKFKAISVREERGKEIVKELTGRTDVEVLVDPTMLLGAEEWDKIAKKPKQLKFEKYILNYFLGEQSIDRKREIDRIAKENNCEIINILDKNDPFYLCGPSEFLYLEKNAFLICTDSFHSCVFAILYHVPFIVFNREDKLVSMNSRIETLLDKFKLESQKCEDNIIDDKKLKVDYSKVYEILEEEKKKADDFLDKALKS